MLVTTVFGLAGNFKGEKTNFKKVIKLITFLGESKSPKIQTVSRKENAPGIKTQNIKKNTATTCYLLHHQVSVPERVAGGGCTGMLGGVSGSQRVPG